MNQDNREVSSAHAHSGFGRAMPPVPLALCRTFTGAIIYMLNGSIFPSTRMCLIPAKQTTAS